MFTRYTPHQEWVLSSKPRGKTIVEQLYKGRNIHTYYVYKTIFQKNESGVKGPGGRIWMVYTLEITTTRL